MLNYVLAFFKIVIVTMFAVEAKTSCRVLCTLILVQNRPCYQSAPVHLLAEQLRIAAEGWWDHKAHKREGESVLWSGLKKRVFWMSQQNEGAAHAHFLFPLRHRLTIGTFHKRRH